jgi:hypothetical protein
MLLPNACLVFPYRLEEGGSLYRNRPQCVQLLGAQKETFSAKREEKASLNSV